MNAAKLLALGLLIIALSACAKAPVPQPTAPDVESLKAAAMKGSINEAEELAKLKDKPAIVAMREVLEKSDNVQVRMAMIQGLGHNNRDFDSVPLFLDIMEKDDTFVELRAKATEAVEFFVVPVWGYPYKSEYHLEERQELVGLIRAEYQKMKALDVRQVAACRTLPIAKLGVSYIRHGGRETHLILPFAENNGRIRISDKYPNTATSYHLEVETAGPGFHWDWNDLVIRVDVQPGNSLTVTAVKAITTAYEFDLLSSDGKVLIRDFGPHSNATYTFHK